MNSNINAGDAPLTKTLENNRASIVNIALNRSLPPERQSLLADALCHKTLDKLIDALNQVDEEPMVTWVSDSLCGFVQDQALFDVFPTTVSAGVDVLLRHFGYRMGMLEWLESIQHRLDVVVSTARLELHEERFSLDSVDAKIDEVLYYLSERDTITAEHSRSVGMWCWRIAKKMQMTRAETLLVSRSGLIHDIGKIKTPLEILTAPRSLSDEEWQIMRRHTLDGVEAIQSINELRDLIPAVRWHHERIDGRGYPDGLDGSAIPIAARIVSVADAFNAMIARRPYRKPLSPTVAIEELKRHSGAHFDPSVIIAMIDVVSQLS